MKVTFGGMAAAVLSPDSAGAQEPAGKLITFDDVLPDFSLEVFVPPGWGAGKLQDGPKTLSDNPLLVMFGGVGDDGRRVLGELKYLKQTPGFDPADVFIEASRQRYSLIPISKDPIPGLNGQFVIGYKDTNEKGWYERIAIGSKVSLSVFLNTADNLTADVKGVIVKSRLRPQ